MTPQTAVMSALLCDLTTALAEVKEQVGGPLLRALDLVPRVPAWITDPDMRASIEAGHIDIPDDLIGEA